MSDSWVKVKVERFQPVAGEEDKWKDPLLREFGSSGQDKAEAWLDFVLRDIAARHPSLAEVATKMDGLTEATAKMAIGGPAPHLPEPTVPVLPSEFKDDREESPEAREQRMVHDVYETIAPHFSQTRYKPWPIIARFLSSIPPHSIGLDSGAGNGKYLPVVREGSRGSRMIALDRSSGLLSVARTQKGEIGEGVVGGVEECVRGDLCYDGWRRGVFVSPHRRLRSSLCSYLQLRGSTCSGLCHLDRCRPSSLDPVTARAIYTIAACTSLPLLCRSVFEIHRLRVGVRTRRKQQAEDGRVGQSARGRRR